MTINRSTSVNLENHHDFSNDGSSCLDSEIKRVEYLSLVRETLKHNGTLNCNDTMILIDVLSQSLSDDKVSSRKVALDLLSDAVPVYGNQLDTDIGLLFPQLLQNLLHGQSIITKSTLSVLKLYYQFCLNKEVALNYLIHHGINSEIKALRNEVLLSVPALVKVIFNISNLEQLFLSILDCSDKMDVDETCLPAVLCIEHIKDSMGESRFNHFFESLSLDVVVKYAKIMDHPCYNSSSANINMQTLKQVKSQEDIVFGFLPIHIIEKLRPEKSWQTRSDAIHEFLNIVTVANENCKHMLNSRDLFDYICNLVDDVNFNVALTSLHVLHQVIIKLSKEANIHLDVIMKILFKKLSDPKVVIRKINLRIGLSLMHTLSPSVFLQSIVPLLKHKNARVREEIINMITASLLSLPSSEFDLQTLPQLLGFTLLDKSKKVRLSSLECFAILAQQLGPRKLSPLVSAIDVLERKNKNADGLLRAVQTRLNRRMLPKINDDELIQYAMQLPSNTSGNLPADIAWILAASNGRSDTARSADQEPNELTERRIFSARRSKLPWQNETTDKTERNKLGSAPIRSPTSPNRSPTELVLVNDAWSAEKILNGNCNSNEKTKRDENGYFRIYKNKMRRIKEAGLKADSSILKSHIPRNENQSYSQHGNIQNNVNKDRINMHNPQSSEKFGGFNKLGSPHGSEQTSPVPLKPTLARSASKKRLEKMMDANTNFFTEQESNESLAHTLPKMKGGLLRRLSKSDLNDMNSPFPSKPAMHRSPSGNLTFRNPAKPVIEETTNLIQMKNFSNSSPAVFGKKSPLAPVQPFGRLDAMPQGFGVVDFNRSRSGSISPIEKRLDYKNMNGRIDRADELESRESHPLSPKLSKSAQEKLRKYKELQHKSSSNVQTFGTDSGESSTNTEIPTRKSHDCTTKEKGRNQDGYIKEYNNFGFSDNKPTTSISKYYDAVEHSQSTDSHPVDAKAVHDNSRFSPLSYKRQQKQEDLNYDAQKDKESGSHKVAHSPLLGISNMEIMLEKERSSRKVVHSPPLGIQEKETPSRKVVHSPPIENLYNEKISNHNDYNNNNRGRKSPGDMNETKVKRSPRNIPPKATSSPKLTRKLSTKKSHQWNDDTNEYPTAPVKSYTINDVEKPLNNPVHTLNTALGMLKGNAEEWETKLDGLVLLRRLLHNHADDLPDIHSIVMAVLSEVKNLRSQVTRSALCCIADIFRYVPKQIELELEVILKTVLPKASDTNQFIRADTESALKSLVENVNPPKAMAAIIATGAEHRNGSVRNVCAKALSDLAEAIGPLKFCQTKLNVAVAGKLAVDSQPEARYNGRRMLFLILDQPDLDYLLEKFLLPSNLKPVRDVVETLKNKGLEVSGSATLRRPRRNGSSVAPSPASTRRSRRSNETSTERNTQISKKKDSAIGVKKAPMNTMDNKESLEFLEMLNSNTWTERYEALDNLYEVVSRNPSLVAFNISKVFDKLVPRLNDSNSKVNLYALQTLNRCMPVLENSLSMVTSLLIENLKPALSSKNDAIYNAGRQCLLLLAKYVDNLTLIKPIISGVQHGNMRNKPDYILSLVELIKPVYSKKPGAITRQVLPFLWNLLSTSVSGVTSTDRPNLQQATCRLCLTLYECMGEELIQEAESKQSRVSQRLEAILNMES